MIHGGGESDEVSRGRNCIPASDGSISKGGEEIMVISVWNCNIHHVVQPIIVDLATTYMKRPLHFSC